MSIANKHLSEAALGRFGDTEMYKTSKLGPGKGKVWHVNEDEKRLMNMYGLRGEKLVDAVGSGTINPKTGKEEKFLPALMSALPVMSKIGGVALSGYESWKSGKLEKQTAKSKVSAAESGIAQNEKASQELEESIDAQKEVFQLEFEKASQDLSRDAGYAFDESKSHHEQLAAKTGMATSGGARRSEEKSKKRLGDETKSKTQDLIAGLGRNMGTLMEEFESEKGRLKSEKEKFERELGLARDQEKTSGGSWMAETAIGALGIGADVISSGMELYEMMPKEET